MAKVVYKRNKQGNRYAGSQTIQDSKDLPTTQSPQELTLIAEDEIGETKVQKCFNVFKNIISVGGYEEAKRKAALRKEIAKNEEEIRKGYERLDVARKDLEEVTKKLKETGKAFTETIERQSGRSKKVLNFDYNFPEETTPIHHPSIEVQIISKPPNYN